MVDESNPKILGFVNKIKELLNSKADENHKHGNITNAGAIGTAANKPVITTTSGKLTTGSFEGTASNIKMNGTQNAGSSNNFARADHVHPTDTSRASTAPVTQSDNGLALSTDKQKIDKSMVVGFANAAGTTSAFTASITGVTLTHGTIIALYNAVGANTASATLNVNSLGAKPIYYNASAIPASRYPNKATCLFMYNTSIVSTGCWQLIYSYDSNTTYSLTTLKDSNAHDNIGTAASTSQANINTAIDNTIGTLATQEEVDDIIAGYVKTSDSRLSDARTPKSHTHGNISNEGVISNAVSKNVVTDANGKITTENKPTIPSANTTATNIKMDGTQSAGSLATFAKADHVHPTDTSRAASSHAHGNVTNDGKIGTAANKPLITGTNGVVQAGSFGTAANTFCQGNDSRLSDARTPTTHTHTKSEITDFPTIPSANTTATNIKMDGTQSAGSLTTFAKADHVHPTDSKITTLTDRYDGEFIGGVGTVNKPFLRLFNITSAQYSSSSSHLIFEIIGNNNDRLYAKIRVDLRQTDSSGSSFKVTPLEVYGFNLNQLYFCLYKNGLNTSLDIFRKVGTYVNFYIRIYDDHLRDGTYTMYKPVVNGTESYTTLEDASTNLYNASYTTTQQGHNYDVVDNSLPKTNLIANSFKKNGGTSSEFLKADGSIDNTGTLLTSDEKTKLGGIATGATKNVVSDSLTDTSTTNALSAKQGKVLNEAINSHTHKTLEKSGVISAGDSLSDAKYCVEGIYTCSQTACETVTDKPDFGGNFYFNLVVQSYDSARFIQTIYLVTVNTGDIYFRAKTGSGWSAWRKIYTDTNIPSASTSQKGIVQLTDSISSTSTTTAATPKSVKTTYDLANSKIDTAGTGLSKSGTTLNHSNNVIAQTSAALKKIKHDEQGHITGTTNVAKSDITGLGIADEVHTHTKSEITDFPTIPSANSTATNIKMDGTQNAGSLSTFAKADHVHPTDTSRASTATASASANGLMSKEDKAKMDKSMVVGQANVGGTTSAYTATITGVTLTHGTIIALYNAVGANAASATLNVNSLGAKPIYYNSSAIPASRYPNKSVCLFMYNTSIVSTGCWQLIYSYDSNNTYTAASATPTADTASGAVGTSAKYAREDHVHPKSSIYAESSHTHTKSEISDFPTSMTPTSHTHGNITNDGKIGTTANKPIITTTSGKLTTGSFGKEANTFAEGNHEHAFGVLASGNIDDIVDDNVYGIKKDYINNGSITGTLPPTTKTGGVRSFLLETRKYDNNTSIQFAYTLTTTEDYNRIFYRGRTSGDWDTWREIIDIRTLDNITEEVSTKFDTAGTGLEQDGTKVSIKSGGVTATQLASNAVTSAKIADKTIVAGDIADTTITGGKLANATVTATQLASNAVETAKIKDSAVTSAKIANGTIVNEDIASNANIEFDKLNINQAHIINLGIAKDTHSHSKAEITNFNNMDKTQTLTLVNSTMFSGTINYYEKNGWATVTWEGLTCTSTQSGYTEVAKLPSNNAAKIYEHVNLDGAPTGVFCRVENGYLQARVYTANQRAYGHITFPIA